MKKNTVKYSTTDILRKTTQKDDVKFLPHLPAEPGTYNAQKPDTNSFFQSIWYAVIT